MHASPFLGRALSIQSRPALLLVLLLGLSLTLGGCSRSKPLTGPTDPGDDWSERDTGMGADAFDPIPESVDQEGIRPGQLLPFPEMRTIYFDYDRSEIRPDMLAEIEHNLRYLLDHPEDKVFIEGHCDENGTNEYNFSLGWRRANAVKDYYVSNGIDANRIGVVSRGEEFPAVVGHSESARAKNRRAEFKRMY